MKPNWRLWPRRIMHDDFNCKQQSIALCLSLILLSPLILSASSLRRRGDERVLPRDKEKELARAVSPDLWALLGESFRFLLSKKTKQTGAVLGKSVAVLCSLQSTCVRSRPFYFNFKPSLKSHAYSFKPVFFVK